MRVFLKIALVGALLLSACFCGRVNRTGAQRGVLDLREADLSVPIRLDGEWEFYWNHLYDPEKIPGPSPDFLKLPGAWNGARSGSETIGGDGFATLRLRLLTPAGAGPLMLKIPHQGTAYEMYADGHLIAKSGKVGTIRDSMTPMYVPRVSVSFSGE